VTANYLIGQAAAGAQILQVFESWAGELSKEMFDEFCLPYAVQILTKVRDGLKALDLAQVPMVIFAKGFGLFFLSKKSFFPMFLISDSPCGCGTGAHYAIESLSTSGYDVVGVDWTMEPREARLQSDDKVTLQGNLDPCALYGSGEVIRAEVKRSGSSRFPPVSPAQCPEGFHF